MVTICEESMSRFLSTPSARRATKGGLPAAQRILFLSTPSARRATAAGREERRLRADFYPRPPRGGRPWSSSCAWRQGLISIHALREEGDVRALFTPF